MGSSPRHQSRRDKLAACPWMAGTSKAACPDEGLEHDVNMVWHDRVGQQMVFRLVVMIEVRSDHGCHGRAGQPIDGRLGIQIAVIASEELLVNPCPEFPACALF